jgi:hypothetical protein
MYDFPICALLYIAVCRIFLARKKSWRLLRILSLNVWLIKFEHDPALQWHLSLVPVLLKGLGFFDVAFSLDFLSRVLAACFFCCDRLILVKTQGSSWLISKDTKRKSASNFVIKLSFTKI